MKKTNLLLSLSIVLAGLFSSCTKDETNDAAISFAGDTGYTATDATVAAGGSFTVKWTATSSTKMGYFSILKDGSAYETWNQKEIPSASNATYIDQATIVAPTTVGTYTYAFVIYDKDKVELVRKSIVITVTAAGTLKAEITNIKIFCTLADGSGTSTCASADGTTYAPKSTSAANQAKVDFVYFYDSKANIYAPSAIPSTLNNAFTSWTTKNATKLAKINTVDYATATYAQVKTAADAVTPNKAETLNVDDVVAFKTATGKVGIFKITSIKTGYTGSDYIIISIKVEE